MSNKSFLIVTADCNDADYVMEKSEIFENDLEDVIKPIIKVLNEKKERDKDNWNKHHNWVTSEYSSDESPKEMYKEFDITDEQIDAFNDYVPYGEYGVHTIERIEIVFGGETLFNMK